MVRKILMIDDDRLQFRLVGALILKFRADKYELDWADGYDVGLERLMSGHYDACLLDYRLGNRDGLQLIREAIALGCRTPIVFLTAEASEKVDAEAMNAGAFDFLVKSEITSASLERSLRHALKLGGTVGDLQQRATRDALTGMVNRYEFDRMLESEAESARRTGLPLALIMVDIDHFKEVNDLHGHPVGDAVLREIARRLAGQLREADWLARVGGEEFAIVLALADRKGARETAERLCAAVRREPVAAGSNRQLPVTISAGVALVPDDAPNASTLVAAADRALYAAKARGRDRVVGFEEAQA